MGGIARGSGAAAGALAGALALAAAAALAAVPARSEEATPLAFEGPGGLHFRLEASDQLRGEFVDWFRTASDSSQPNFRYNFLGNRFKAGLRVKGGPAEVFVQFQHTLLDNLPEGGPGPGGAYFANTRRTFQQSPILRQAWLQLDVPGAPGFQVQVGRFWYLDGAEVPAADPTLAWLIRNRIGQRLIGPFEYTLVGRSFDGGRITYQNHFLNVTGFGFLPTRGGFEIDANQDITEIVVGGLSATIYDPKKLPGTAGRFFWIQYDDERDIVFLDNRPREAREADRGLPAEIGTIGANVEHVQPLGPGVADALVWGVGQFGDWQSQDHRAWAFAVEAGYQLPGLWGRPWLRVGIDRSSGDDDPNDDQHESFFQLLPTARIYAQFPFYNLMNNQDVFAQAMLRPRDDLDVRIDGHWLRVVESRDLAYFGGGATSENFFGYGGVPARGRHELSYLADIAVTWRPTSFLKLYAYYGHAFGQGVIAANFLGRDANYGYLEGIVHF